jgi:hypothetical protein
MRTGIYYHPWTDEIVEIEPEHLIYYIEDDTLPEWHPYFRCTSLDDVDDAYLEALVWLGRA